MEALNSALWSALFLPLLLVCGLVLTLRCRFLQFRCFGKAISMPFKRQSSGDALTPFQAACTALASTVGTGNIIGTAQAIAIGGRGAVFWLWVSAIPAMIIKYAEIFLGLRFRRKSGREKLGGPMYYIEQGLGARFRPLAPVYAFLAGLSVLCMGDMAQISGAVSALEQSAVQLGLSEGSGAGLRCALGLILAAVLLWALSGGAKSVGRISALLVPFMSGMFLLFTSAVIVCHAQALPSVLRGIVHDAFSLRAAGGAAGGLTLRQALHWGVRRGAFSNEAGLGYAAIAHGATDGTPAQQGLWGIFEVFADTVVICTATALAILCSGVDIPWGSPVGVELFHAAAATVFGDRPAAVFVAASLFLFAFSTVLGCSVYGLQCARYLSGAKGARIYRGALGLAAVIGSAIGTGAVWSAADTVNALMSVPNFIALLGLSGLIARESNALFVKKSKGKPAQY